MPTNIAAFKIGLSREVEMTREQANLFKRRMAIEVLRGVILRTPVDTGAARGNWQVTISAPTEAVKASKDKAGHRTIVAGAGIIDQAQYGQNIYLSNNLPYIGVLENGRATITTKAGKSKEAGSIQAPAGMVRITLESVERRFAKVQDVVRR